MSDLAILVGRRIEAVEGTPRELRVFDAGYYELLLGGDVVDPVLTLTLDDGTRVRFHSCPCCSGLSLEVHEAR